LSMMGMGILKRRKRREEKERKGIGREGKG
jgi:hypothetical protein